MRQYKVMGVSIDPLQELTDELYEMAVEQDNSELCMCVLGETPKEALTQALILQVVMQRLVRADYETEGLGIVRNGDKSIIVWSDEEGLELIVPLTEAVKLTLGDHGNKIKRNMPKVNAYYDLPDL